MDCRKLLKTRRVLRDIVVVRNSRQRWFHCGVFERYGDKPAAVFASGTQAWVRSEKYHRDDDKPAIIHFDGSRRWYQNGIQGKVVWSKWSQTSNIIAIV